MPRPKSTAATAGVHDRGDNRGRGGIPAEGAEWLAWALPSIAGAAVSVSSISVSDRRGIETRSKTFSRYCCNSRLIPRAAGGSVAHGGPARSTAASASEIRRASKRREPVSISHNTTPNA